jgi:hypothetical protein
MMKKKNKTQLLKGRATDTVARTPQKAQALKQQEKAMQDIKSVVSKLEEFFGSELTTVADGNIKLTKVIDDDNFKCVKIEEVPKMGDTQFGQFDKKKLN